MIYSEHTAPEPGAKARSWACPAREGGEAKMKLN